MKLDGFSLVIPEGKETQDGYVQLKHGTVYAIVLTNDTYSRCDAEVQIDGGVVGNWRIDSKKTITLERPVHSTGRFTFFTLGTTEAQKARIQSGSQTGLISVLFRPGDIPGDNSLHASRASAGGTGLTGKSTQTFTSVAPLQYYEDREVTINIRLVSFTDEPRPLHERTTPIPPPIG